MASNVKVREIDCMGFSAYEFANDSIKLTIVPEIGGRIMSFGTLDSNILYQNPECVGLKHESVEGSLSELKAERIKRGYVLYGGEKTWIAPQDDWDGPPYMDLDHGTYDINIKAEQQGIVVELLSPICSETKLRIKRIIEIPNRGNKVTIHQRVENHGSAAVRKGVWQVAMLDRPAVVVLDCSGKSEYEDGIKLFGEIPDKDKYIKKDNGKAYVYCEDYNVFKVGTDVNKGYVDTLLQDKALIFKIEFEAVEGIYGHGCAVEVFNSVEYPYLEVEVHSPLKNIAPGDSVEHTVYWSISKEA